MPDHARLAVSNIAWDATDDDEIAALLTRLGVAGVEIAPTKWRSNPIASAAAERAAYRQLWEDRGLPIVAMQALLFGQPQLRLFADASSRVAMAAYLRGIIELGAALGAGALVFGSPKNRARNGLAMSAALDIATDFFAELGAHAVEHGTTLCIEANPPAYGCDFITTTAEAVDLCNRIASPGVRVNGDLGAITMSGDDPATTIASAASLLGHFHASEPQLAELGAASDHASARRALSAARYGGWISIEMRDAGAEHRRAAIERAVLLAQRSYGTD